MDLSFVQCQLQEASCLQEVHTGSGWSLGMCSLKKTYFFHTFAVPWCHCDDGSCCTAYPSESKSSPLCSWTLTQLSRLRRNICASSRHILVAACAAFSEWPNSRAVLASNSEHFSVFRGYTIVFASFPVRCPVGLSVTKVMRVSAAIQPAS